MSTSGDKNGKGLTAGLLKECLESDLTTLTDMDETEMEHQVGGVGAAPSTTPGEFLNRAQHYMTEAAAGGAQSVADLRLAGADFAKAGAGFGAEQNLSAELSSYEKSASAYSGGQDELGFAGAEYHLGEIHGQQGGSNHDLQLSVNAYNMAADAYAEVGFDSKVGECELNIANDYLGKSNNDAQGGYFATPWEAVASSRAEHLAYDAANAAVDAYANDGGTNYVALGNAESILGHLDVQFGDNATGEQAHALAAEFYVKGGDYSDASMAEGALADIFTSCGDKAQAAEATNLENEFSANANHGNE